MFCCFWFATIRSRYVYRSSLSLYSLFFCSKVLWNQTLFTKLFLTSIDVIICHECRGNFFRVFKDKCINVDTIFLQFHDSSRVNWDSMGILCLFCSEKLFRLKKTYWIHKIGNVSWKWLCEVIMTSLNLMLPSFSITLC